MWKMLGWGGEDNGETIGLLVKPNFLCLTLCVHLYSKLALRVSSYSSESRLCSLKTANHAPWGCNQLQGI